jgi:hypothetical protein
MVKEGFKSLVRIHLFLAVGGGIVGETAQPYVLFVRAQCPTKQAPISLLGAKLFLQKYSDEDFQGTRHQHQNENQLYLESQNHGFRSLAYLSMFICSYSGSENEDV